MALSFCCHVCSVRHCVFSSTHHLKISAATVLDLAINYCDCVCSGIDDFEGLVVIFENSHHTCYYLLSN